MTVAILNGYNSLIKSDGNTEFTIAPPAPYLHSHTKIKRWWNQSYDKVTYTGCALIAYRDSYVVVSCEANVLLKIIADNNNEPTFNVIFKNQGDGGIRRILVCPKTELYALVNYDDYYYDYSDKQIKKVKHGNGGLDLNPFRSDITYGITSAGGTFNLRSTGAVDYTVDWGDGNNESSTSSTLSHTYTAGDYTILVNSDNTYRPYFNNVSADVDQITSVAISGEADLGTNLGDAWRGADNMTSFVCPFDVTSGVTSFYNAWRDSSSLTSFPLIDTGSGTSFVSAWNGCSGLSSFPMIDTSSGTSFNNTWQNCSGLSSFPMIDTSSGTIFSSAWNGCSGLSSFPQIDTSSGTRFFRGWYHCSGLSSFPANMFDATGTLSANAFKSAWTSCALTAQSIENILISLDTNGASNISLGINHGTNAAKTTWSTAANTAYTNLINKGWTISYNA